MATTRDLANGLQQTPAFRAAVDAAENAETVAQEREVSPTSYRCPDVVWQGPWKDVADILGIYDWRVWVGVTAALSARAHRNIWANYHKYLYGMGAYLLVASSAVGKALVTDVCDLLLPRDYNRFDSVESGQALAESLAEITRDEKGKIKQVCSFPAILITSEWSQLLKTLDFHGSTLMERLHKAIDGERSMNLNRADKHGQGKITIDKPTLTLVGTTTEETYQDLVKDHHIHSGFMNRHLIMPTEGKPWRYNDPNPTLNYDGVEAYGLELQTARTFGLGQPMGSLYYKEAYDYDDAFGKSFLEPLRNGDVPRRLRDLLGRLHVHHRRLSLLYAWATKSELIRTAHVQAAEAAVRTSYQFLVELHGERAIELPSFLRARGELEEKILAKVASTPECTKDQVCQALRKNGGYTTVSEAILKLVEARALTLSAGGGRGNKSTIAINRQ